MKIAERAVDCLDCTASDAAKSGHDPFRLELAPDTPHDGFTACRTLGLGSGGNGKYQMAEDLSGYQQAAMEDEGVAGTWDAPPGCSNECNRLVLGADGSGRIETVDCAGSCTRSSSYVALTWTTSGSTLTLNDGYGETCGEPNPLNQSVSYDYTCSGDALTFDGTTWTRL